MELSVKLPAFEGPLDLLLHLIDKNKIDIYDIPIVLVTDQYLDYVRQMPTEDLDLTSEFMVMAATLLDIKCRMLLPKEVNEEGEEEDPRAGLVEQLLQYKMYKYMSYELKDRMAEAGMQLYHEGKLPREVAQYRPPVDTGALLEGLTLNRLHEIFQEVLRRQENKRDPIRSSFGRIEKEEVSLTQKAETIRQFAMTHDRFTFREMLQQQTSRMHMVVAFLVILEFIKGGGLKVEQENTCGEIILETVKERIAHVTDES